ncbi:hypothetical protein Dvina_12095 [Dactylosporangium vinaceum]|uniref:Mce-associated membrane protein n=1 Tax=Dactylosporangium vinaceum TaxID=53362 RepID=A0ABV5MG48_9ACTN|nr:hypothetical protein [Dactylosporangium vinaceum]UAB98744.1 hypothetical protein Dvina_12095 [Dactylosporangium vinaceum]
MPASEERGLRLVAGGAESSGRPEASEVTPRSVRRRAAARRRAPVSRRRDTIAHVLAHLDEEPEVLDTSSDVAPDEDDAGKRSRRRAAPRRRGPAQPVRRRLAKPVQRRRLARPSLRTVLLALLVCAAVAAAAAAGQRWYAGRALDQAQQQALAAARQTTVDFVSVSAGSVDRDLQRIVAGATGDFRDEFTRGQAQVRAAVVENNVDSKGTVLRAALVSGDRHSAVVLVAVDATVKNAKAPEGRASHYRIQVDMARDRDSGRWLVAKLQFVG